MGGAHLQLVFIVKVIIFIKRIVDVDHGLRARPLHGRGHSPSRMFPKPCSRLESNLLGCCPGNQQEIGVREF